MKLLLSLSVLATLAASSPASTQQLPPAVRDAANRIQSAQLKRDLEFFSADALRGRATFTAGFDSAAQYIARRLKQAGLEPMGAAGSYFQHYDVATLELDTSALYLEIGGRRFKEPDLLVLPGEQVPQTITAPVVY